MPSLILTGHPCIGKTTFAHLLASRAIAHPSNAISNVIHIREATACPDQTKAACYSNSHTEKTTRAALKSEFDRAVAENGGNESSTLVILDSLNYIKGYRYELYCISKAAGERHGVVWIMGSAADGDFCASGVSSPSDELAKKRNRERKELQMQGKDDAAQTMADENYVNLDGYFEDDDAMNALVLRYEPPDDKNRWENPMYKVDVTSVLPWGKDGTIESSSKNNDGTDQISSSLNREMTALAVDATSSSPDGQSSDPPKKAVKKSASGFKRRGKKTTQQNTSTQQPPAKPSVAEPTTEATINVPSSMASRNLKAANMDGNKPQQSTNNNDGSRQKMEQVIDSILDSFLTNIAPLQEGLSTLKQVSAESNVLNQVDNVTQRINNEILKAQKSTTTHSAGVGGKIFIPLSGGSRRAMNLSKPLYANELRTCRRQFLKWIAGHPMRDGTREEEIVEVYVSYIESNI